MGLIDLEALGTSKVGNAKEGSLLRVKKQPFFSRLYSNIVSKIEFSLSTVVRRRSKEAKRIPEVLGVI